ncbi:MAG: RING finger protein [Candidatus Geothermincolia bacterium]
MDCKWHSGTEADLVCLKCGQSYCRECVIETREAHYCPDCHRESVERLAVQMGGRKEVKPPKVKEPKAPRIKEPKPLKEKPEKLRKPSRKPMGPTLDDLAVPPPVPVERPAPSMTPEEKAAFWGDGERHDDVAPFTPVEPAPKKPATTEVRRSTGPVSVKGMPPPLQSAKKGPESTQPAAPLGPAPGTPAVKKRPIPTREAREAAIMTAEGFPTGEAAGKGGRKAAQATVGAQSAEDDIAAVAGTFAVKSRIVRMREKRRSSRAANLPVAMQIPDDYDGEVTTRPSYLKAVLYAMLVGLVTAAAFSALAWLVHKDLGIFGWVIGFGVGFAVAFGSGRHFSWKLGLIAAAIALFWVSVERIGYFMLDVRFNKILPIKLGIWPLFRESLTTYLHSFWSLWLLFFVISGLIAFIVAFRPPPIKLQLSGEKSAPPRRTAGGKA